MPPAPTEADSDLSWVQHVIPEINAVLAEHTPHCMQLGSALITCWDSTSTRICAEFDGMWEWRNHVAPHIAERLEAVTLALPEEA